MPKTNPTFQYVLLLLVVLFFHCKGDDLPTEGMETEQPTIEQPTEDCEFLTFKLDDVFCALDEATSTYYYAIPEKEMPFAPLVAVKDSLVEITINYQAITNFAINDLGNVSINQPLSLQFKNCEEVITNFQLVFTTLPIIQLSVPDGQVIRNEPKIEAKIRIQDPYYIVHGAEKAKFTSTIGIETRGGSTQGYEKKSYSLELKEEEDTSKEQSEPLLGMRDDDDWILDAMVIDDARMRNRASFDIWMDLEKLYYQSEEPKAKSGTVGELVEVFLNDEYRGVYTLTDRVDRKQLKLNKNKEAAVDGLLYKSVAWSDPVLFKGVADFDNTNPLWQGWEQKYPDTDDVIFWDPLANFIQFVVESSDADFKAQIGDQLDLENAANYFLFLNLMRADDNRGKNIYLAKYQLSEPFFIVPWDLDATWGLFWDRSKVGVNIILTNNLFDRLIATNAGGFKDTLKSKWNEARTSLFTKDNLLTYFEKYRQPLEESGAYQREHQRWEIPTTLPKEMEYLDNWIGERLRYLNDYFQEL